MLNQVRDLPHGLCACGCGMETALATVTDRRRGHVRGQHLMFVHGHNRTRQGITTADYVVDDRGHQTPCWIWNRYISPQGYGKVGHRGKVRLAHIVMYEQEVGPIPSGSECDHLCREPACINPAHIEPVGHRENVRRGRAQKLTWEQVCAIREDDRSSYAVARDYGISHSYAWKIQTGQVRVSD